MGRLFKKELAHRICFPTPLALLNHVFTCNFWVYMCVCVCAYVEREREYVRGCGNSKRSAAEINTSRLELNTHSPLSHTLCDHILVAHCTALNNDSCLTFLTVYTGGASLLFVWVPHKMIESMHNLKWCIFVEFYRSGTKDYFDFKVFIRCEI